MNNCDMYQELISRLVDGELSREEYAALDAHMENCAECSAMYAVFASLSDIIGGEDEPLPEDLHENIMAGVRRSAMINHNRRRLSKPVRNALAAAACAALVLFASRGLAPEKAADTVLSESQTAAMDAQVQATVPAPAAATGEAAPQSPAASEVAVPAATEEPVASPVPTKDIYLESGNEAKSAAENTNKTTSSVAVTPKPTEIPVHTPVTVNTPKPTPTPAPVVPTATAAPVSTAPVEQTEAPAAPAEEANVLPAAEPAAPEAAAVQESSQPAPTAVAEKIMDEAVPAPATAEPEPAAAAPASEETAAAEPEPVETDTPSLTQRFFSFFSMARPAAETEAAPAEAAVEESPAEPEEAEPEMAMMSAAPPEEEKEEKKPVRLDSVAKLFDLENLLDGVDAQLPEGEADEEYSFVLKEPEEGLEEYQVTVYIYGEKIYYEQRFSEEEAVICASECTVEDFEKFMEGLSDEEKGIEASPAPSPAASAEPAVPASPAVSEPAESPVPTEPAAEQ